MVLSGILMNFEHPFDVLFFVLSHLFLSIIEICQISFVIVTLFVVSVVKIIKNRKAIKIHYKFSKMNKHIFFNFLVLLL